METKHPNPNSKIGSRRLKPGTRHQPRHVKEESEAESSMKMVSARLPKEDVARMVDVLAKINADRRRISKQDFLTLAINSFVAQCEEKLAAGEKLDL